MAKKTKPMTKPEMLDAIAKDTGATKVAVESIYNALITLVAKETKKGVFTLPGLGKFSVIQRKARTGRNPQTGEPMEIAASKVPSFKASKTMQDALGK